MYGRLLKTVTVTLIVSLTGGVVFALCLAQEMSLSVRLIGYSTLFLSLLIGFVFGEHLSRVQGSPVRTQDFIFAIAIGTLVFVLLLLVGTKVRPLIGRSENQFLFPALFALGTVGGFIGTRRIHK